MPRRPRVIVEGAIYHVYNRFARGAEIFAQRDEAERFVALIKSVKKRDGLTVLAWCLMSNHYHLAVRIGPVLLARTMGHIQAKFSMDLNRRWHSSGPLWQSRYKAKMVTDHQHLLQLIAYVHSNPVSAGIIDDPADYRYSGHKELLGKPGYGLVDADGVLMLFGATEKAARKSYLGILRSTRAQPWKGEEPGGLPWWRREVDRPLEGSFAGPQLDALGRFGGLERMRLSAEDYVRQGCKLLESSLEELVGGGSGRDLCRRRHLIVGLGIERWGVRAGQMARIFGRRPEVVSRWAKRAGELRTVDDAFRASFEKLDAALAASLKPPVA